MDGRDRFSGENSQMADAQAMKVSRHSIRAFRHHNRSSTVANSISNIQPGRVITIRHIPLSDAGSMLPPNEPAINPVAQIMVNVHSITSTMRRHVDFVELIFQWNFG